MRSKQTSRQARRSFVKRCGLLLPGAVFLGVAGWYRASASTKSGLIYKNNDRDKNNDQLYGKIAEVIYEDNDSSAYLVELKNGEHVIGFGPPQLDLVSFWERPELVNGIIPSVICHPDLPQSSRRKLARLLDRIA